jgi:predicted membrane-bound dolichyl-phosphate-mannose-protein mannosyltransferase
MILYYVAFFVILFLGVIVMIDTIRLFHRVNGLSEVAKTSNASVLAIANVVSAMIKIMPPEQQELLDKEIEKAQ